MKYKVGDRVLIRDDLVECGKYGSNSVAIDMLRFRGRILTIENISACDEYRMLEDTRWFCWTDEMIERKVDEKMEKLVVEFKDAYGVLAMRVVHMDESLRDKGTLATDGKYAIESDGRPQIAEELLYVNGRATERDGEMCIYNYGTVSDAATSKRAFERLIKQINSPVKKMTVAEIQKLLGYKVEIVEG